MKKISINRREGLSLIAAGVTGAVGALLLFCGNDAVFAPMKMAAWLHFSVAALLVLNVLWPAFIKLCARGAENERWKRLRALPAFFVRWGNPLGGALFLALLGGLGFLYWYMTPAMTGSNVVGYLHVLLSALAFAALLITARAMKYFAGEARVSTALISTLDMLRLNLGVMIIGMLLLVTGLFDPTAVLRILQFVMAGYCGVFLLLCVLGGFVRGECATGMRLSVPRLFSHKEDAQDDLIAYLEKSTGITLRSLFGIRVIRKVLPLVVVGVAFGFWLSTGVVQVESYQQAALYRFGRCHDILEPGLHVTLPYPFDKVELYDTERVNELVVGYDTAEKSDLLWTEAHGGTEYKLLLGNGNELVSVNLRIKYKISDLRKYVTNAAQAEKILNAKAYSVVTDITVRTTLDALLAEDRAALSQKIEDELAAYLTASDCGLAVVDAILESFHPPVEVSTIYQQVVSAELLAQAKKDTAEGLAASAITFAENKSNILVIQANIRQQDRVAAARAAVAEFMAMKEAYAENPDAFCYYKYLNALSEVYKGQRLYIISDGIDQKYIYFGNGVIVYNDGSK